VIEARRGSRILAVLTLAASPVVMSLGKVGLVVALAALVGSLFTMAGVELAAARDRRGRS